MTKRKKPRPPKARKVRPSKKTSRQYLTLGIKYGDLLETDLAALDWITRYVGSLGYPPSVRDLQDAFSLSSTREAYEVLKRLEAYGFLDVDPVARGIRLHNLPDPKEQGVARLKLWIVEGAALLRNLAGRL